MPTCERGSLRSVCWQNLSRRGRAPVQPQGAATQANSTISSETRSLIRRAALGLAALLIAGGPAAATQPGPVALSVIDRYTGGVTYEKSRKKFIADRPGAHRASSQRRSDQDCRVPGEGVVVAGSASGALNDLRRMGASTAKSSSVGAHASPRSASCRVGRATERSI